MIVDELARQVGNSVFCLVDQGDGLHQMHLEPSCCHLTAFITPFGVYEWLVLPMGVKVGQQVFQRLVQWVLRTCPHGGPYIDVVLTGREIHNGPAPVPVVLAGFWTAKHIRTKMLRSFCSLVFPRPLYCLMALEILKWPPPTFMIFLRVLPSVIFYTFTTCVFWRSSKPLRRLTSVLNHPSVFCSWSRYSM